MAKKRTAISDHNLDRYRKNLRMVREVSKAGDKAQVSAGLSRLINTVHIFYTSKQDFLDNFPQDDDDINGKIKLIVNRRQ